MSSGKSTQGVTVFDLSKDEKKTQKKGFYQHFPELQDFDKHWDLKDDEFVDYVTHNNVDFIGEYQDFSKRRYHKLTHTLVPLMEEKIREGDFEAISSGFIATWGQYLKAFSDGVDVDFEFDKMYFSVARLLPKYFKENFLEKINSISASDFDSYLELEAFYSDFNDYMSLLRVHDSTIPSEFLKTVLVDGFNPKEYFMALRKKKAESLVSEFKASVDGTSYIKTIEDAKRYAYDVFVSSSEIFSQDYDVKSALQNYFDSNFPNIKNMTQLPRLFLGAQEIVGRYVRAIEEKIKPSPEFVNHLNYIEGRF